MKKLISLFLCFSLLFAMPVSVAAKTVQAVSHCYDEDYYKAIKAKPEKAKKIGLGITEVQVPQFPKIKNPNALEHDEHQDYIFVAGVRYVVPESGTYKIEFSDYNCKSKASVKTWTEVRAYATTTPWSAQSGTIVHCTYLTDMTDKERKALKLDYDAPFSKLKFTAEKGEEIYISFRIPEGGNIKKLKKKQGNSLFSVPLPEVRKSYSCKIKLNKV